MKPRSFIDSKISEENAAPFFRILFTELKGVTSQENIIISVINLGLSF